MEKKKKVILIVSIIIMVLFLVIGGTVAYFGWATSSEEEALVNVTVSSGSGSCSLKKDNDKLLVPTSARESGRIIKLNAKQEMAEKASIVWNLVVNEINGLQDKTFKYELVNSSTGYSYGSGTFENITSGSTITFSNSEEALGYNMNYEFTLYLWIDGTLGNNPISMSDQILDFDMNCVLTGTDSGTVGEPPQTLVEYITNLYTDASKTKVTNNSIEYNYANIYDIDDDDTTSGGLMNDRLGGTTDDYDAGNIRYYGANPNNYIYFNCTTYPETECETWRIIGAFDGKVKIMRNSSIGNFAWDNKNPSTGAESYAGSNDWTDARLMKLLNPGYESESVGGSLYYNAKTGTCYSKQSNATVTCDFTSTGLKNDTTRNMVSDSLWYLGGWQTSAVSAAQIYEYERGDKKCNSCTYDATWTGKVGLAYPSDYGYAVDFNSCEKLLHEYHNNTCTSVNWMKSIIESISWFITPFSGRSGYAWYVSSSGLVVSDSVQVCTGRAVVPVLNLDSELIIMSGTGSSSDPYRIGVN